MRRLRYVHWHAVEARERAERLREAGYDVVWEQPEPGAGLRGLLGPGAPEAVVIDLGRLPSAGRDLGIALRMRRATRHVPLVFVGGDPPKVDRVRKALPDAVFAGWETVEAAISGALDAPPSSPVVPTSGLAGYEGTPLPRKLGVRESSVLMLVRAPKGFEKTLGRLPPGVTVRRRAQGRADVVVWFVRRRKELEDRIRRMRDLVGPGFLWIAWPKQASGAATDLTQGVVRKVGLASGMVDSKVCSIDGTWSGLRFTRRRRRRA